MSATYDEKVYELVSIFVDEDPVFGTAKQSVKDALKHKISIAVQQTIEDGLSDRPIGEKRKK